MIVYLLLTYKIWREEEDFKSYAPSQLFFSFFLFDLENLKLFYQKFGFFHGEICIHNWTRCKALDRVNFKLLGNGDLVGDLEKVEGR
jgi:hypothetical protein